MRFSLAGIILILFFSCSRSDVPGDILPPEKIQPIIFDLLRADEFVNNFVVKDTLLKKETEAIRLYEQVFLIHKVTAVEFYKSYKYYQSHPDVNKSLIDSLNAMAKRKLVKPELKKPVVDK